MLNLLLAFAALFGASAQAPPPVDRYAEGQVWEYRTRPGEEASRLKVQRIEDHAALGRVYHVSVIGVRIETGRAVVPMLNHLPVSRATLDGSVTRLADGDADFPDIEAGIAEWRRAEGGVFSIGVAEIVAMAQAALSEAEGAEGDSHR